MPLDINLTLSDHDLGYFQTLVDKAKRSMDSVNDEEEIVSAARQLIDDAKANPLPAFIDERLSRLHLIIDMIGDEEWRLSEDDRQRVLGGLVYFCSPEDVIPDHIPGLGFLDDAIYVELILRELRNEVTSYEEFCEFRRTEEERRRNEGLDPYVGRDEWLAVKRAALQTEMQDKRKDRGETGRWKLRW